MQIAQMLQRRNATPPQRCAKPQLHPRRSAPATPFNASATLSIKHAQEISGVQKQMSQRGLSAIRQMRLLTNSFALAMPPKLAMARKSWVAKMAS